MRKLWAFILVAMLTSTANGVDYYISADISSDDRGAVLHSTDGANWAEVYDAGNFNGLNAIWAADSNHIWAVGRKGTIVSYDGQTWTQTTLDTGVTFEAISGIDANNIWVVGSNQTIYRFNGSTWTKQGANPSYTSSLLDVGFINNSTGWATDTTGLIYKYNGTNWVLQSSFGSNAITAITAITANNAWAAGSAGSLIHYDGSTWQKQAVINDADYYGSFALDSNNIWVVGSKIWTSAPYGNEAVIMKYNGSSWALQRSNVATSLYAVSAQDANNVWAVGYGGKITHCNGSAWVDMSPSFYNNMAGAFTGIVIVPEPSSVVYSLVSFVFLSLSFAFRRKRQRVSA